MNTKLPLRVIGFFCVALAVYLAFRPWDDDPAGAAPPLPDAPGERRQQLLKEGGGNAESEAAVARGLAWLSRQQQKDGSWKFDGSSKDQMVAATGMALLPFLAVGENHKNGVKYKKSVEDGLNWLLSKQAADGGFGTNNMYAHAIATTALCEAAWRAKDPKVKEKAATAVGYIVHAQCGNGSWGYTGPTPVPGGGDTSIVGWQVQALHAARLAGIKVDDEKKVLEKADKFLVSVSTDDGAKYGYRERGASQTLTPVGLLSRQMIGSLVPNDKASANGVEFVKQFPPQKAYFDMYYYFYATRVAFAHGGYNWHKFWNPKMRDLLIDLQKKTGEDDVRGSWDKDQGFIGSSCGKVGTTALAILTLEVYYRYPLPPVPKGFEVPGK
jgi:hypothetical protein